jgi:hypothetical protein
VSLCHADRLGLQPVVLQHRGGHLWFHAGKQGIPLVCRKFAVRHGAVEKDLDVHLMIGGVYTGGNRRRSRC